MVNYTCPCSNVKIEAPVSDADNGSDLLNQIQNLPNENDEDFAKLDDFIRMGLLNKESWLMSTSLSSDNDSEWIDSHLKLKYPLLVGILNKGNCLKNKYTIKLSKCLICDIPTHCLLTIKQSNLTRTNNQSLDDGQTAIPHNNKTITDKPSVLENRLPSSHSSQLSKDEGNTSRFCYCFLVNSKQMILDSANTVFTKSNNYSCIYDILLDDHKEETVASPGVFDAPINMVSIIEQRRFTNQIEEKYRNCSQKDSNKEEVFKIRFENLVSALLKCDSSKSDLKSNQRQGSGSNNSYQLTNRIQLSKQQEIAKPRMRYDETALSSSVFEMEEIDELDDDGKFLPDQDSQDEFQEDLGEHSFQKSVLKKRNSNIGETDFNNTTDMQKTTAKLNFSRTNNFLNNRKDLSDNKYSCSLPRDIPIMMSRSSASKIQNQKEDRNNENYNFDHAKEQPKKHTQLMTNSYKHSFLNYNISNHSNDLYDDGDDELFEEDTQANDDLDDDDTSNMGRKISNLASSIVQKDGRELFGGVPSRRVPINSISKSFYE